MARWVEHDRKGYLGRVCALHFCIKPSKTTIKLYTYPRQLVENPGQKKAKVEASRKSMVPMRLFPLLIESVEMTQGYSQ